MTKKGYRECSKCGQNRSERFFVGKRGRICDRCRKARTSKYRHEERVMATYGLAKGEYETLFASQGGVCAICHQSRKQRLSVDHCHKTGVVRGLLCRLCNGRLLTAARDSPEVLRNAAAYLEAPPAVELLGERFFSK